MFDHSPSELIKLIPQGQLSFQRVSRGGDPTAAYDYPYNDAFAINDRLAITTMGLEDDHVTVR